MYLNTPKEVTKAHLGIAVVYFENRMVVMSNLPSLTRLGMQDILGTAEVKGAATLASASERETPT